LCYKDVTPGYADLLDNPDGFSAPGPGGGFTWDGRADTLAEQVKIPRFSPIEMANEDEATVVKKVFGYAYVPLFEKVFTGDAERDPEAALMAIANALQAFQVEDPSFHPYTSKFDRYARNKIGGTMTPAELRGMKVFGDPAQGNCGSCHYS